MSHRVRLILFAKAPIPGQVKTRLGKQLGFINAANIYRRFFYQQVCDLKGLSDCSFELYCTPTGKHPFLRQCARQLGARVFRQQGRDLGLRMYHALRHDSDEFEVSVLMGSDIPRIDRTDIEDSIRLIRAGKQLVLMPTLDGGYGLIAMKTPRPELFRNMRWSHPRVLAETLARVRRLGWDYALLGAKPDIDTKSDYLSFVRGL